MKKSIYVYEEVVKLLLVSGLSLLLYSCEVFTDKGDAMIEGHRAIDWRSISSLYVQETKKWADDDFTLELINETTDKVIVDVVNKDDLNSIVPGAGKSFQIYINKMTGKVVNELGYQ